MMRPFRIRRVPGSTVCVAPDSFIEDESFDFDTLIAGAKPKRMPVASATHTEKTSTCQSICETTA